MSTSGARRAISWFLPEAVLLGLAAAALHLDRLRDRAEAFAQFYPLVVFALGILLALRFQRSRLVFALLALALVDWGLGHAVQGRAGEFVFLAMATLLPLNLAAIALMSERGTLTRTGLVRLGALLGQVAIVAALVGYPPFLASAAAAYHATQPAWLTWTPVPAIAVGAFALGALVILGGIVFFSAPTGRAFLWALLASFLALHSVGSEVASTIYLSTAGLILVVAVIEASYLMAYHDGLTGLPARRALNEALQSIHGQFTIAMVDVDHFKKLNDRYGHDVGDQVLRMVASRLSKVNGGGRAYRYGGEEFAILFPGKELDDCLDELEALRASIQRSAFTLRRRLRPRKKPKQGSDDGTGAKGRKQITVTVSIGAAEPDGKASAAEQVIQAADKALYRAKDGGRNRVER